MSRSSCRLGVLALCAALLTTTAAPLLAHPLDVYVQAAALDVTRAGLVVELRLTPGVYVAPQILGALDTSGDGRIGSAEQAAYADRVRGDLSLAIDGRLRPLHLVSSSFAAIDAMRQGLGDIVMVFQADGPLDEGTHTITLENHHQSAIAAYLMNVLAPREAAIRIVNQTRTYDQSRYHLDVAIGPPSNASATGISSGGRLVDQAGGAVLVTFVGHGIRHILTGYDHLLFLGALVLAAVTLWDLVTVVTAFTIAHSMTLTLAALQLVHVPDRIVEPVIAGSIVFVAVQNVAWPDRARGRTRLVVAFVFGLFHGLGFAGGLLDAMQQMPAGTVAMAIVGFSLGVEAGNQIVLIPLFASMRAVRRVRPDAAERSSTAIQRVGSAGIAAAGFYYLAVALTALG
jgi:hypothetical protein